jgi:hypothetical protein
MNITELLLERTRRLPQSDDPELTKFKQFISNKIKTLPETDEVYKTLREIEDLLQNVNAGGRLGLINNQLSTIPDESVKQAQKELARYIAGMNISPADRDDLFNRWKNDTLINHKLLLSPGRHAFNEIVNGYETNPAIKELTEELMRVEAYGHGKGEFILNVFSKKINKPENNKGDLLIDNKSIEVKTTDAGGARFGDQEVKPGPDFFNAVSNFTNSILTPLGYKSAAKSGINVKTIQELYAQSSDKTKFKKYISPVVKGLYPAADTKGCLDALFSGDYNSVRQEFAIASLTNYLNQKKDYGVLYVDISKDPSIFIFFRNNEELNDSGFRLDISTQYLVTYDTQRVAAQFTIIPSNRLSAEKLSSLPMNKVSTNKSADIPPAIMNWARDHAKQRNVTDPTTVKNIASMTMQLHSAKVPSADIIKQLETKFPALKYVKKKSKSKIKNT